MTQPLPVGVLEAKKEDEDPMKGMQQAKNYADCDRFDTKYVFATNGHLYGEFDKTTGLQSGNFPFADFPTKNLFIEFCRFFRIVRVYLEMSNSRHFKLTFQA